jgi:hypothetical protein
MPTFPTVGHFPLTGVAKLPNVTIAFPGEHWSNRLASGAVTPGEAVIEVSLGGKLAMRTATSAAEAASKKAAIATRVIDPPDGASDSLYTISLGPNEIKNRVINHGEYVHAYFSGVFHLTLITPRAWAPSDLVEWDPAGARPTGKSGTGSWKLAAGEATAVFSVVEFRPFSANGQEGLLTVRSVRGQF